MPCHRTVAKPLYDDCHLCMMIVTFAAACMTWELAESGKHFITTIINGSDLVPTFSTSSIDDLRSEVLQLCFLLEMVLLKIND